MDNLIIIGFYFLLYLQGGHCFIRLSRIFGIEKK
jgi:hypothetical protein